MLSWNLSGGKIMETLVRTAVENLGFYIIPVLALFLEVDSWFQGI